MARSPILVHPKATRATATTLPRPSRWARAAGGILALAAAACGRPAPTTSPAAALAAMPLRFVVRTDSVIEVRRHQPDSLLAEIPASTTGPDEFTRQLVGTLRRERTRRGVADDAPYLLVRWSDDRVTLDDSTTGTHVALDAFGARNAGRLAVLVAAAPPPPTQDDERSTP